MHGDIGANCSIVVGYPDVKFKTFYHIHPQASASLASAMIKLRNKERARVVKKIRSVLTP